MVYGPDGKPTWYLMEPGEWIDSRTFHGPLYETSGPYLAEPFESDRVKAREVGFGVLKFDDSANGTFLYSIDGINGEKRITRMEF